MSGIGYLGDRPSKLPFPACDHLLADDSKFHTDEALYKIRGEIGRLLDEAFSKKSRAEWQQIFCQARICYDLCMTYNEVRFTGLNLTVF
jgi:crotonobetainyl-CoA:carnitine CoA-transferase CaiB-like acyl-CoA transferase